MQCHTLWTSIWDWQWAEAAEADSPSSLYVGGSVSTVQDAPSALEQKLDPGPTEQWFPANLATQPHSTEASKQPQKTLYRKKKVLFSSI